MLGPGTRTVVCVLAGCRGRRSSGSGGSGRSSSGDGGGGSDSGYV